MQRGRQTENDTGQDGKAKSESENARVRSDLVQAGRAGRAYEDEEFR